MPKDTLTGRFVIVAYTPKPGMDAALLAAVKKHLLVLSAEKLVTDRPAYAMRASNGTIVEVFEWRSADAIKAAHSNPAVQALWAEFGAACEFGPLATLSEAQQMFAEFDPIELESARADFRVVTSRPAVIVMLLLLATVAGAHAPESVARFDVSHYDVYVEPTIADKTVRGRVIIDLSITAVGEAIEFDIGALTVDSVREGLTPLAFSQEDRRLHVVLKDAPPAGTRRRLEMEYHGAPRFGLTFVPEKSQVYTIFSTDQWMPCVNAPSDRATLQLTVVLPSDLKVVANGREQAKTVLPDGRTRHQWLLDTPAPTFSFGFAAAKFNETDRARGKTKLRFLSAEATGADLDRIFVETADMIAFFEDRSGVKYDAATYSQALVHDTAGQEMSTFALMSDEYGQAVLADAQRVGLIAHELAHQWWGIGVACEDWTHFWLNEGFATFMAAAYREKKFGRDVYLTDVLNWRARYDKVKVAGKDRSLAFPDWNKPTSDDRALVYQKGALVLHELRARLGEKAFWSAIRSYTREFFGRSVKTADFQVAMEKSSKRSLAEFFDEWVYITTVAKP